MNKLLLFFFIFSPMTFAQVASDKIIYLDEANKETSATEYKIKRVIKEYDSEKDCYEVFDYNKEGVLLFESTCTDKFTFSRNGDFIAYHENGSKKSVIHYQNSKPVGDYREWYSNGKTRLEGVFESEQNLDGNKYKVFQFWNPEGKQEVINGNGYLNYGGNFNSLQGSLVDGMRDGIWRGRHKDDTSFTETYEKGKFISGESTDENGKKITYTEIEKKPEPKEGLPAFYKYIAKKFKYTKESEKKNISGKIIIQFIVDKNGEIVEPKIVKSLGYGLDEEAIRVLMSCKNWNPGQQRGRNVSVAYMLPISLSKSE